LLADSQWLPEKHIGDSDTIPLRKVTENREYANLPLIATKWKLVGFVDEKRGTVL
jgi:hypothetical protein